jgi:hypothetical protein
MRKIYIVIVSLIIILLVPFLFKSRAVFPVQSYCNVQFANPVYEFKDSYGNSLFVLDEHGNLYINSTKVLLNQNSVSKPVHGFGLRVNSLFFAGFNNSLAELKGEILEKQTIPDTISSNEILFRNPVTKEPIAMLDSNGNLLIKGLVVYNGYYPGLSVDVDAFNSNCTTEDGYLTVSGSDVYRDYYCNRKACVYRDVDLDLSQSRCEAHGHYWSIGGNIDATTCCEDDEGEYKLTRQCNSGCISDATDDACCDNSDDAVNGSVCYSPGSEICSPDDNTLVIKAGSGKWDLEYNCTKECADSCNLHTSCSDGACIGSESVPLGKHCVSGSGAVSGLCNTSYACSNATGDMTYNDGGRFNCTATCDGSGSCSRATNCIDCSKQGDVNGCACACGGYGVAESTSNGNCNDGIDNDCDGKRDSDDPDCCLDEDGDGYGKYGRPACPKSGVDCCDNDSNTHPGQTAYFTEPNNCSSYDYNCSGTVEKSSSCYYCHTTLTSSCPYGGYKYCNADCSLLLNCGDSGSQGTCCTGYRTCDSNDCCISTVSKKTFSSACLPDNYLSGYSYSNPTTCACH